MRRGLWRISEKHMLFKCTSGDLWCASRNRPPAGVHFAESGSHKSGSWQGARVRRFERAALSKHQVECKPSNAALVHLREPCSLNAKVGTLGGGPRCRFERAALSQQHAERKPSNVALVHLREQCSLKLTIRCTTCSRELLHVIM